MLDIDEAIVAQRLGRHEQHEVMRIWMAVPPKRPGDFVDWPRGAARSSIQREHAEQMSEQS